MFYHLKGSSIGILDLKDSGCHFIIYVLSEKRHVRISEFTATSEDNADNANNANNTDNTYNTYNTDNTENLYNTDILDN